MGFFDIFKPGPTEVGNLRFAITEVEIWGKKTRVFKLVNVGPVENGVLEIPAKLKGKEVREINPNVFMNRTDIKVLKLPTYFSVYDINFKELPNLEKIEIYPVDGKQTYTTFLDGKVVASNDRGVFVVVPTFKGVLDLTGNLPGRPFLKVTLGEGQQVTKIKLGKYFYGGNFEEIFNNQPKVKLEIDPANEDLEYKDGTIYQLKKGNRVGVLYANKDSTVEHCVDESLKTKNKEDLSTVMYKDLAYLRKFKQIKCLKVPQSFVIFNKNSISELNIEELVIENKNAKLRQRAIHSCPLLKKITISGDFEICYDTTQLAQGGGNNAFWNLPALQEFVDLNPNEEHKMHYIENGILYLKSNGLHTLVKYPTGRPDKEVKIKEDVAFISGNAFEGALVEHVTFPEKLVSIGDCAFKESNIREIILPDSVTSIGNFAFYKPRNKIEKIVLPFKLNSVEQHAFEGINISYVSYRGLREWWPDIKKKISPIGNDILVGPNANVIPVVSSKAVSDYLNKK